VKRKTFHREGREEKKKIRNRQKRGSPPNTETQRKELAAEGSLGVLRGPAVKSAF
jgi:hypothetical protein